MELENRLKGKTAFITGASSGIGKEIAFYLAKEGVNLVITARRYAILEELKKDLESKFNVKILARKMDVTIFDSIKEVVDNLPNEFKNIDILINNSGLAKGLNKVYDNKQEEIDVMIDTNIKGTLYTIKNIVPSMIKKDTPSTIINIGSIAGDAAYEGGTVYCATKAAIKTISDGLRLELVDSKIKVTNVKPGIVETNFSLIRFDGDKNRSKSVYDKIKPLYPKDIAEIVTYICNLPDNVQIPSITVTPNYQADGIHKYIPKK